MSLLETHARYSAAISILNRLRHALIGRALAVRKEDKEILLESLEITESEKLSGKMVLYSFHGFGSHPHAAAIELSDGVQKVLDTLPDQRTAYINALKKAIEFEDVQTLGAEEKSLATDLVKRVMYVIDSQEDVTNPDTLIPRDL
jgi:hemerythrin-like domain-containing protein